VTKSKVSSIFTTVQAPIVTTVIESNKIVTGNIGRIESRTAKNTGNTICKFSIADNDQMTDECTWYNVVCFKSVADKFLAAFQVGDLVRVTGDLKATSYTNKAGEAAIYFEINTVNIKLISKKTVDTSATVSDTISDTSDAELVDSIPF